MVRVEKFKPQLKPGRLIPEGQRLVYETDAPVDQIILPIEMVDFLLLCNGDYTVAEIIELLYQRKGTVQFKAIYKTLQFLKIRNFLVNGELLETSKNEDRFSELQFLFFKPAFEIHFGRRIFSHKEHPHIFYFASLSLILFSIYCLHHASSDWFSLSFMHLNGSYLYGLIFTVIGTSTLLTLKNVFKTLMLILLTGRAYNFSVIFNGLSLYFFVKSDSLYLVSNRLFITLFHLAIALSYFPIVALIQILNPSFAYVNESMTLAFILLLFDLNPFQESELSIFLRSIFNDDTVNKISRYINNKSLLSLMSPRGKKSEQSILYLFTYFSVIWSAFAIFVCTYSMKHNFAPLTFTLKTAAFDQRAAALLFITITITLTFIFVMNLSRLFLSTILMPSLQQVWGGIKKRRLQRITHFDKNEILSSLESLPLFNYFNQELLELIIERSALKEYSAGAPVIVQGEEGLHLFVLLKGSLSVQKRVIPGRPQQLAEIYPPSIFGEIAVIEEVRRAADVVATSNVVVLEIPAKILKQLAEESQYIRELDSFRNAIMVNQFFSSAPIFRDISESVVHIFTAKGKIEQFEKDQVVFKQGEPGDGFYLLLRGAVGVSVNGRPVARIQQGGFFGEVSMITEVPRTATIYALDRIQTLKISKDVFWEILSHDLTMAMFIESVGEMRIREDIEVLKSDSSRVAS